MPKTSAKNLNLVRAAITVDDDPVAHLKRLTMETGDLKGQVASGYGERGGGVKLNASLDFGKLITPFGLTAELSASLKGSRTSSSMIVVHRLPSNVRDARVESLDLQRSTWHQDKSVALLLLSGATYSTSASATAKAGIGGKLGLGENSPGEVGLAASVVFTGDVTIETMSLADSWPSHYRSLADGNLSNDVGWMLNQRIKPMIIAWLKNEAESGPVQERSLGDLPGLPDSGELLDNAAAELDLTDIKDKVLKGKGFVDWLKGPLRSPSTNDLNLALDAVRGRALLEIAQITKASSNPRTQADTMQLTELHRVCRVISQLRVYLSVRKWEKEGVRGVPESVQRRQQGKTTDTPGSHLDITTLRGHGSAEASLKAGLKLGGALEYEGFGRDRELAGEFKFDASAAVSRNSQKKSVYVRYQVESGAGSDGKRLFRTQDAVVTTTSHLVEASAKASAAGKVADRGGDKDLLDKKASHQWGRMTYRAATAYWLESDVRSPLGSRTVELLLNGSGVSFGVSIGVHGLKGYRALLDRQDKPTSAVQNNLVERLQLTRKQAREFVRSIPEATLESLPDTRSVLIEAGFALTSARLAKIGFAGDLRPDDLAQQNPFKDRIKHEASTPLPTDSPTALQVIRVRERLLDRVAPSETELFKLGMLAKVGKVGDPVAFKLWPSIFTVESASAHRTVEHHTHYYGPLADEFNRGYDKHMASEGKRRHHRRAENLSVPPVTLFDA